MVDYWWQYGPGKVAAPPTLIWEPGGGGSGAIFPVNTVYIGMGFYSSLDQLIQVSKGECVY